MTSDKAIKPRLALYVYKMACSYDASRFELAARVVTVGPTPDYPDLGARAVRFTQTAGAFHVDDLRACAWGYERDPYSDEPQGTKVRQVVFDNPLPYHDQYRVNCQDAEKMWRTLSTILRRLDKLREKYGYPETFGAYVARLADVLGCDQVVLDHGDNRGRSFSDSEFRFHSVGDGAGQVDYLCRQWTRAAAAGACNA